jgi:hypothetical protein
MLATPTRSPTFKQARMEILGGMMPLDDTHRERNLRRAYELGKRF